MPASLFVSAESHFPSDWSKQMSYSTDFFQNQELARKKSFLLVTYFSLALLLIIVATYAFMVVGLPAAGVDVQFQNGFYNPLLFFSVVGTVIAIIGGATLFQLMKYRRGGGTLVAELLGGELVISSTKDHQKKKLLNIVQEMSIASGVPVPAVYVMQESGINAFAAGYGIDDTVIAVTQGCLDTLNRDELQGVVAHEFSHILNGDMNLNLRLTGVLYGLHVLSVIGYLLLRLLGSSGGSKKSSSDKKKGGGEGLLIVILLAGFAFMVLGFLGEVIGKLIQLAFSRQREFLADASAVQFTRNPHGVAGALKKIGGFSSSSHIHSGNAKSISHMFFADGLKKGFSNLMSTHPDLVTRIQRIDPSFKGDFPEVKVQRSAASADAHQQMFAAASVFEKREQKGEQPVFPVDKKATLKSVGTFEPEHVAYAAALLESIPSEIMDATRDTYSARMVVFILLISKDESVAQKQFETLTSHLSSNEFSQTKKLHSLRDRIRPQHRLALVELALPSLGQMSSSQYLDFLKIVHILVQADNRIDAFEFVVRQFLKRQYDRVSGMKEARGARAASQLRREVSLLLSTIARQGAPENDTLAQEAFRKGISRFASASGVSPLSTSMESLDNDTYLALDKAVDVLSRANAKCRKAVIEACSQCVMHDEKVTLEEFELIRAVGEMMGIPIPPHIAAAS